MDFGPVRALTGPKDGEITEKWRNSAFLTSKSGEIRHFDLEKWYFALWNPRKVVFCPMEPLEKWCICTLLNPEKWLFGPMSGPSKSVFYVYGIPGKVCFYVYGIPGKVVDGISK